jgi:uncharacterized protein YjiS (DUF1127 family)
LEVRIMRTEDHAVGQWLKALIAGLAQLVCDNVIDPVRRHARSRAGERAMAQLDDRLLRDIGLTRSQVHAAAWGLVGLDGLPRADPGQALPSAPGKVVRLKRRASAARVDAAAPGPDVRLVARG